VINPGKFNDVISFFGISLVDSSFEFSGEI
jgi:hypothetical protein